MPKVRYGSYFPSILEPRRPSEKALRAAVMEAYVNGVSTRKVEDLVQALGLERMDKSQVSRICSELDVVTEQFRSTPISGAHPYLWLDATYIKVRENGRVMNMAAVVAVAVQEDGRRKALNCASVQLRIRPSGCSFCGDWSPEAYQGSNWSAATPTRA